MFIRFLVATLSQQMRIRVYTPSDGDVRAYKVDDAFFSENPKRRFAIREAFADELENGFHWAHANGLSGLFSRRPQLWMLVISSGNGTYRVLPVWRGQAFFPVEANYQGVFAKVSSDAACLALLDEADLRGGVDAPVLKAWEDEWNAAVAKQQSKLPSAVSVH